MSADNSLAVKDTVYTPDGKGKVTAINDRYVHVDLENDNRGVYGHREIFLDEKLSAVATVTPPEVVPTPAAAETPEETEQEIAEAKAGEAAERGA